MAGAPTFTVGGSGGPTFEPSQGGPRFDAAPGDRPAFEPVVARPEFVVDAAASPAFDDTAADFSAATGGGDMIHGGSSSVTGGAGVGYIGENAYSEDESRVQIPTAALTARRLFIRRTAAPGPGCACTYTLRRNGQDTSLVVTLGANDTSGASPIAETVVFLANERLSVKETRSGDVADGVANFAVDAQYQS